MNGNTASASSSNKLGEPHRIYWQQWPSSKAATALSRRDLITSSAAIRISSNGARARDVTQLLCETLNLNNTKNGSKDASAADDNSSKDNNNSHSPSWDQVQDAWERDCLVLVGTLYSLPLQFVRFEHERLDAFMKNKNGEDASVSSSSVASNSRASATISRSDPPFHVIKTLSTTDNPIEQRNRMMKHLERVLEESAAAFASSNGTRRPASVSPKLQWYFVPGSNHPSSPIPSYIDLDGYSTSLEDDDDEEEADNDEDDTENDENDDDFELQKEEQDQGDDIVDEDAVPAENESSQQDVSAEDTATTSAPTQDQQQQQESSSSSLAVKKQELSEKERIFKKERQRYFELSMCQSSLQHDCVSGYLLKQSMTDPHVWKRVHCVLTDEHLWYISRIHTRLDTESSSQLNKNIEQNGSYDSHEDNGDQEQKEEWAPIITPHSEFYSYAKHRRLGLTRALLIQPSKDRPKAPLFRTPFAFELIDSNGGAHRFRASNLDNYKRWVAALSSRIVQAYENSLLEHAELIVRDETTARNKRMVAVAVEPLWEHQSRLVQHNTGGGTDNGNESNTAIQQKCDTNNERHCALDSPTMQILKFGMEVAEFRERCRHVQAILPARYPVLAMTDATPELKRNSSDPSLSEASNSSNGAFRLDSRTQALIKSVWDEAVRLGGVATKLAVALQTPPVNGDGTASTTTKARMPRCLETICQHLEYVITGNFRGALTTSSGNRHSANSKQQGRPDNTRQYPPPIDLFDQLLSELQSVAAAASATESRGSRQSSGGGNVPNSATNHGMNGGSLTTAKQI